MDIAAAPAHSGVHPLLAQLVSRHGFAALDAATFDAWIAQPGAALIAFADEPARVKESLDLAVIAPEIARAFAGAFRTAALLPPAAREIAARYGFRRWPALVMLADGRYVGAIDGLRDWPDYLDELERLLAAAPTRAPSIGIPVAAAGDGHACH